MKKLLILVFIILPVYLFAQIQWSEDYEIARKHAAVTGKIIVLDFTATWCGPCAEMDRKLWSSEDMEAYKDKFVFVKVDIDTESVLARYYSLKGVPTVKLITANEDILWTEVGYSGSNLSYLRKFKSMPDDVSPIYFDVGSLLSTEKIAKDHYQFGLRFQDIGKTIEDDVSRTIFINQSTKYFAKVKNTDAHYAEVELQRILNLAYLKSYKRVLKKLEKLDESEIESNKGLYAFIQCIAYHGIGDEEKCQQCKQTVIKTEMLAELSAYGI